MIINLHCLTLMNNWIKKLELYITYLLQLVTKSVEGSWLQHNRKIAENCLQIDFSKNEIKETCFNLWRNQLNKVDYKSIKKKIWKINEDWERFSSSRMKKERQKVTYACMEEPRERRRMGILMLSDRLYSTQRDVKYHKYPSLFIFNPDHPFYLTNLRVIMWSRLA